MKNRGIILAGIMSMSWISMTSTASIYTLDISSGKLPEGVTAVDGDGLELETAVYKKGKGVTDTGWTIDRYGNQGYVLVSPTYTVTPGKQDNRLTLPSVTLTDKSAAIRWGAVSVHPDCPDSYDVIVVTPDGKEDVIFTTSGESPEWTMHAVDLSEYAGKEIIIKFVVTSDHGYLLAVDDIEIGEMTDVKFQMSDHTPRYAGIDEEKVKVAGTVTNLGKSLDFIEMVCKVGDEVVDRQPVNEAFSTGNVLEYEFEVTPELNRSTHYYICGIDGEGNETAIHDDSFFTSYFRRTLLVDKGTGMWCNNCPDGILTLESLQARYGEQLIAVETHAGDDVLAVKEYWNSLKFYAAPYFKLNRNESTSYSDDSRFSREYEAMTSWMIEFSELTLTGDHLSVGVKAMSALDVDNNADRYRISYLLTRDYDEQPEGMLFYQSNNMTSARGKRFYYLPSTIPGKLIKFHDVTLPSELAFTGIESSLPAVVEPYKEYQAKWDIPVAGYPADMKGINIVVYVLDTSMGRIKNAATMTLDHWNEVTSIESVTGDSDMGITITSDGHCRITFGATTEQEPYTLELFNVSGTRLYSVDGYTDGCGSADYNFSLLKGVIIARLNAGDRSIARKFVIK